MTPSPSPFHQGEQLVQHRAGVREMVEKKGRAVIRELMPDQHRAFFEALPFLVVSTADRQGQPWASLLFGPPGFVSSPEPELLAIDAWPAQEDPIAPGLLDGEVLGCLGIELPTRRRNRVNGRIEAGAHARGFVVRVQQSFGNCPKYIQSRQPRLERRAIEPVAPRVGSSLDVAGVDLITRSDTFFIASRAAELHGDRSQGLDVSHRGGLPGFVRILSERELVFPDYAGNLLFNTLGNIAVDPRVGLLFIDFGTGTLLHLAGRARIDWISDDGWPAGAERLVFVVIEQMVRREQALPFTFGFQDYSPHLAPALPR